MDPQQFMAMLQHFLQQQFPGSGMLAQNTPYSLFDWLFNPNSPHTGTPPGYGPTMGQLWTPGDPLPNWNFPPMSPPPPPQMPPPPPQLPPPPQPAPYADVNLSVPRSASSPMDYTGLSPYQKPWAGMSNPLIPPPPMGKPSLPAPPPPIWSEQIPGRPFPGAPQPPAPGPIPYGNSGPFIPDPNYNPTSPQSQLAYYLKQRIGQLAPPGPTGGASGPFIPPSPTGTPAPRRRMPSPYPPSPWDERIPGSYF
jgi:hypothetical protein